MRYGIKTRGDSMATVFDEVSIKGMRKEHFYQLLFYLKTCDEIGMYYGNQKQYLKRQNELKRWLQDIITTTNSEGVIIPK
jgi:ABC-type amino acid transport substrate-binding protein